MWIETHTRKDGTTLARVEPFMVRTLKLCYHLTLNLILYFLQMILQKLVKEKIVESKQRESGNSSVHLLSIDNDPLTQVFVKKSKGLPGVGSYVSRRRYDVVLHSHIMYTEERGEREDLKNKVEETQTKVNFIFDYCKVRQPSSYMKVERS